MITDGLPQYHHNGNMLSEKICVNLAVEEYRKGQKYCRNMMCINISPNNNAEKEDFKKIFGFEPPNCEKNLKRIFKKNYVEFPGMERASEFVLKNFRKTVTATLRR